jgi:hypothetical protein
MDIAWGYLSLQEIIWLLTWRPELKEDYEKWKKGEQNDINKCA